MDKTELTLNEKLIHIQSELKATKDKYNTFGKYKYRSCEGILESVKPLLAKYGVSLMISDDIALVGNRFYIKATATLKSGDETCENTAWAREEESKKGMDASQVTGATSSYARKYALNGLFCIDDSKDADTDEYHNQQQNAPQSAPAPQPIPQDVVNKAMTAIANAKTIDELKAIFNNNQVLQTDANFMGALTAKKKELTTKAA